MAKESKKSLTINTSGKAIDVARKRDFGVDKEKVGAIAQRLGLNVDLVKKSRLSFATELQIVRDVIKAVHIYMTHPQLVTKALKRPERCPTGEDVLMAPIKIPTVRWRDGKRKDVEVDAAQEIRMHMANLYNEIRMKSGDIFLKAETDEAESAKVAALKAAGIENYEYRAFVPLFNVKGHKARIAIKQLLENCHMADPSGVPLRIVAEFVGVDKEEQAVDKAVSDVEVAQEVAEAAATAEVSPSHTAAA